jgi:hypothetical protein
MSPGLSSSLDEPRGLRPAASAKRHPRRYFPTANKPRLDGYHGQAVMAARPRRQGDAANVALTAVGYNFRRILAWLRILLRPIPNAFLQVIAVAPAFRSASYSHSRTISTLAAGHFHKLLQRVEFFSHFSNFV